MKLIVHPHDETTTVFGEIYKNLSKDNYFFNDITKLGDVDRCMFIGHGDSSGLHNPQNYDSLLINRESVPTLKLHTQGNIYLWCYSAKFLQAHKLKGLGLGMFISQFEEAEVYGLSLHNIDKHIEDSNRLFINALESSIQYPKDIFNPYAMYSALKSGYDDRTNPVVEFNKKNIFVFY